MDFNVFPCSTCTCSRPSLDLPLCCGLFSASFSTCCKLLCLKQWWPREPCAFKSIVAVGFKVCFEGLQKKRRAIAHDVKLEARRFEQLPTPKAHGAQAQHAPLLSRSQCSKMFNQGFQGHYELTDILAAVPQMSRNLECPCKNQSSKPDSRNTGISKPRGSVYRL